MKRLVSLLLILLVGTAVWADQAIFDQVDEYQKVGKYSESVAVLEDGLSSAWRASDKAGFYWRLARAYLNIGDDLENAGADKGDILDAYEKGEEYADKAIEVDPGNPTGYFWKSANIGRAGQVRGILNSLSKAKPMRDLLTTALEQDAGYGDAYYTLGMLYDQVPGSIISFGNDDYAVSLGRKAIDAREAELRAGKVEDIPYSYYIELANHLWERGWSEKKRDKEQPKKKTRYNKETDVLEKNFYYEGTVNLKGMDDREEAVELMEWVIDEIKGLDSPTKGQLDDLKEAEEILSGWK